MKIRIETEVFAPLDSVWAAWTSPSDIRQWNYAIDDWHCPRADLNLEPEGRFNYRMEARDGSVGFDFEGTFTSVTPRDSIEFKLEDDREVTVVFRETDNGVLVIQTFEVEDENTAEQQKQGWQNILNNFRKHVEQGCER